MADLLDIILATDPALRNRSLDEICSKLTLSQMLEQGTILDNFRRGSENLYEKVRSLFFLYAIHRFHVPAKLNQDSRIAKPSSLIPFGGFEQLLHRRFEEAIDCFL